ncbi:MAG: GFA family protein [Candidatus Binatia bacterium]
MRLHGSCQCGKVRFSVESTTPYPYQFCYCSICAKTSGALTCNIMGARDSLRVSGKPHLRCYHAVMREPGKRATRSPGERWFCADCGSHLYVLDERWPEGVWPNAAVIDTELPVPPEHVQLMMNYKPDWVPTVADGPRYPELPELSIADWHAQHELTVAAGGKPARRAPQRTPARNRPAARKRQTAPKRRATGAKRRAAAKQ